MYRRLWILCLLGACYRFDLSLDSPDSGSTITDHQPITFAITSSGHEVHSLKLTLDGVAVQEPAQITPDPGTVDCTECSFQITWPALEVLEGDHSIGVQAFDDGMLGGDAIELTFADMPELALTPDNDLQGVGMANLQFVVIKRGPITASLSIDAADMGTVTGDACGSGCPLVWPWVTADVAAGDHPLVFTARDSKGNHADFEDAMHVDDIVRVTQLEVTNEVDPFTTLDMEVHMFDSTGAFIGCAGSPEGLGDVAASDILYNVVADLRTSDGRRVGATDIGARTVHFEVWEDDLDACPSPASSDVGDDYLGASANMTVAQWRQQAAPMAFGTTKVLTVEVGRPLTR
jgi:hypothetical protein